MYTRRYGQFNCRITKFYFDQKTTTTYSTNNINNIAMVMSCNEIASKLGSTHKCNQQKCISRTSKIPSHCIQQKNPSIMNS